jgi:hypothetical protein
VETYAHFGIGIGIYFSQLLILTGVTFICGMIMVIAARDYEKPSFGDDPKPAPFCAVCTMTNITATVGCGDNEAECLINYRPHCDLPFTAAIADLAMCAIFVATVFFSRYAERKIEDDLDDSIQTATDYSVVVMDPNPDADNPDEWYEYFSEYGTVRYVTIFRRNTALTDLIMKKHKISKKLVESCIHSSKLFQQRKKIEKKYNEISRQLEFASSADKEYPVSRVYVSFETEEDQCHCLSALKIPDLYSKFDIKEGIIDSKHFFRGDNVLSVKEPPEPDNILWQNVELTSGEKSRKRFLSFFCSCVVFVACWYIVQYTKAVSPLLLAVVIGIIDSSLPTIFTILTNLGCPQSEGSRQYSIQMRLFLARFLISVIIPYFQTPWESFLTEEELSQIISVQFFTCFTAPLLALSDYYGVGMRHIFSFYLADTQDELNLQWLGSEWSLAEKYTGIAKVLSVSLFYAIFSPLSILLSTVAFAVIFFIDNFLLLRRWKNTAMLDAKIATRLRQQAMLAIFAHMYATLRFIYAWPMDQAWLTGKNGQTVEKIDKTPPYAFWALNTQDWHSESQKAVFYKYKIAVFIVGCIAFYMFVIEPLTKWYCRCFCFQLKHTAEENSENLGFSDLESVKIYYPLIYSSDELSYLCSYTKNLQAKHRPVTMTALQQATNSDSANIQQLLKEEIKKSHLSISSIQTPGERGGGKGGGGGKTSYSQIHITTGEDEDDDENNNNHNNNQQNDHDEEDFDLSLMEGNSYNRNASNLGGGGMDSGPDFSRFGLMNSFVDKDDLSFYIPLDRQPKLLSVVKYYPMTINIVKKVQKKKRNQPLDLESGASNRSHGLLPFQKKKQISMRVLNNLKGRKGFAMTYMNFQLFWRDFYDMILNLDDHLWEAADGLIHDHQSRQEQLSQSQKTLLPAVDEDSSDRAEEEEEEKKTNDRVNNNNLHQLNDLLIRDDDRPDSPQNNRGIEMTPVRPTSAVPPHSSNKNNNNNPQSFFPSSSSSPSKSVQSSESPSNPKPSQRPLSPSKKVPFPLSAEEAPSLSLSMKEQEEEEPPQPLLLLLPSSRENSQKYINNPNNNTNDDNDNHQQNESNDDQNNNNDNHNNNNETAADPLDQPMEDKMRIK